MSTELATGPQQPLDDDPLGIVGGGLLLGYARVSTRDQNLGRQLDALNSVGCSRIFQEKLSGKNAERPELQSCLDYARAGDTIVVLELWRLGRNLQDLLSIVGDLRRRGIGFKSLHESLDTTTPGGRLIFHVFAALAEFVRELIVQGTHEGLDAARARGARLGRPPAMTPEQVQSARDLLGNPNHTVSSIARLLGVSRSTIYKYIPGLATAAISQAAAQPELLAGDVGGRPATTPQPLPARPKTATCPTCGNRPTNKHELELHREGLETVWLAPDPARPGQLIERWHCEQCQPHRAEIVMCPCGKDSVMISDDLVGHVLDHTSVVARWLTDHGWIHRDTNWYCGKHSTSSR